MKTQKWYDAMAARKGKGTNQFTKAAKVGLPKPEVSEETKKKISKKSKGRVKSEEEKKKISESRIKYLKENPSQVPYLLNHASNGPSYPEIYWKAIFETAGIKFTPEYRIGLYSLDFALLDKKIDIEIDGEQHYTDKKIIESDKRRNEFLENQGWKIIRIRWSEYLRLEDKLKFRLELLKQIK